MPKRRYEHQTPTHEWSQIRPLLKDAAQIKYELIRPVILWGINVKERAAETGEPRSTIYHQANLFDQAGMASLLPPVSPPPVPKLDKRTLPPPMRQAIVDLHAEYPEHHIDEIARILYAQFGRRPSAQTIKLTLANGPKPSRTTRRFPLLEDVTDPRERRLAVIKLHAEGWTPTSIAGYLALCGLDARFLLSFKSNEWQFHIINVQRRMGDWYFETAQSWEDLVAVHEKWVLDYNFQKHLAHEKREDGRHSPAEVLGWVTGKQFEPDSMYRAFSAICEIRTLTRAGYARFRDFLLYGERGLASKKALINIFQDTLALEYGEQPLAKYSVEWQPDDKHLLRVANPRLYDHPNPRPQLDLWPPQAVEWFVILKAAPYGQRPRHKRVARILVMQPPLLTDGIQR